MDPVTAERSGTQKQRLARGVLATALLLLALYTLREFLPALVWALVFAIALWPLYNRCRRNKAGREPILMPLAFTLAVALVFIVPLGLVGYQLARESHTAAEWVQQARDNGIPQPAFLHQLPYFSANISNWWQDNLAEPGSAQELLGRMTAGRMSGYSRELGMQVTRRMTLFVFTLVSLFFLFRDGEFIAAQARRGAARMFGSGGERVGKQIVASVHGTVTGLVLVGLGEGVLLGVVYAVAGVPHPTVFGALTAVAAMIPLAAPVVFGIAALVMAAQGSAVTGGIVFAIGMAVTFTADHFVRPVLIGGATRLPFVWVLLGILGGVEAWGLLGLFLGPAIMAALILMWREYAGEGL